MSPTVWLQAARLRTLSAAVVPVVVGSATAGPAFDWRAFALALIGALAIQVGANFANDVSDAARGADPDDRLGPARMVAAGVVSPRRMWLATWAAIAIAALCGIGLTVLAGPLVLVIGLTSIVALLGYVGGPFPYGYRGLGEVFVFVFFGLVATVGSRYVHDGQVEAATWLLAVAVGFLAVAILVANNLRDLDTDARVGKRTLAVIIGDRATRYLYAFLIAAAYLVILFGLVAGVTSPWTAVALLTLPMAARMVRTVATTAERSQLGPTLGATARLHLVTGILIATGTVAGSAI
ncbi:MAG: 1,4-dihydroxy-2-naphthoate polyprenyltransferase [Acidimicrobiia bacterium]|nr:1,4-dihydroxy-2-naphthoate polyprenyltransferase [Acidimicrobiia bacterium]